jgi:hypothetical protein
VARVNGIAAVVAEDEPLTARDLDGSEVILIPILFVDFIDSFAAKAGRQQVAFAGQVVFADIFVVERNINNIVVWWNGICFFAVVNDGARIFPVHLENVDKIEIVVDVGIVDIKNALSDLEDVAGKAAEALDQPGRAFIGWGRAETNKAKASGFPKAGSEQEFASQS